MADDHPDLVTYQFDLSSSFQNLSNIYQATNRLSAAEAASRRAVSIRQKLADDYPNVADYQNEAAASHGTLASVYYNLGRLADSEAEYRRAVWIGENLTERHPEQVEDPLHAGRDLLQPR